MVGGKTDSILVASWLSQWFISSRRRTDRDWYVGEMPNGFSRFPDVPWCSGTREEKWLADGERAIMQQGAEKQGKAHILLRAVKKGRCVQMMRKEYGSHVPFENYLDLWWSFDDCIPYIMNREAVRGR
jgi:hypothetical protein